MVRLLSWMGVVLVAGAMLMGHEARGQAGGWGSRDFGITTPARAVRVSNHRIVTELGQSTTITFTGAPLAQVVESISVRHRIPIVIDKKVIEDADLDSNPSLTVHLKDIRLSSALKIMLRGFGLTWMVHDEVVLITTPEAAEPSLTTRVYDVTDLTAVRDEKDEIWYDCKPLVDTIIGTQVVTTWEEVGGPGAISGMVTGETAVLIVVQTEQGQASVCDLLAKLRKTVQARGDKQKPPRRQRPRSDTEKAKPTAPQYGGGGFF